MEYWATEYLKTAATVSRLAEVAKQNNIPLVGDWRYPAKLLAKQTGTPAGRKHYQKVVGFVTPDEQRAIQHMRANTGNVPGVEYGLSYPRNGRREGIIGEQGEINTVKTRLQDHGFNPKRNIELQYRLQSHVEERHPGAVSDKFQPSKEPPGNTRLVHTHPGTSKDIESLQFSPHRSGDLGHVFPSSLMDRETVSMSDAIPRFKKDVRTLSSSEGDALVFNSQVNSPDRAHAPSIPKPYYLTAPIVAPETGAQSVTKLYGLNPATAKMYFKQDKPWPVPKLNAPKDLAKSTPQPPASS